MKVTNLLTAFFCSLLLITFATSCSNDDKIKFNKPLFEQERANWTNQNLQNYTFSYKYYSSTTGPISFTLVIRNGAIESESSERGTGKSFFNGITDIYDFVERHLQEDKDYTGEYPPESIEVDITYNDKYHYPSSIKYSIWYSVQIDGGGDFSFELTDFKVLD